MYMNELKILNERQSGYGLLIENDAGYISNTINNNNNIISENFDFTTSKDIYIDCVLQKYGVPNRNNRIYPEDILKKQVENYFKLVNNKSAVSEADHPQSTNISLLNITHLITNMWWGKTREDNFVLYGTLKLITSPGFIKYGVPTMIGDKIVVYLSHGIRIGISSRGVGSVEEKDNKYIVQNDYELVGFDLVATPSTFGAYLYPEGLDNIKDIQENKTTNKKMIETINYIDNFINS